MALTTMMATTWLVVGLALVATCVLCVGSGRGPRTVEEFRARLRDLAPYLGAIALFSVIKHATGDLSVWLSRVLDWDITGSLYGIEGLFVAHLQALTPSVTYGFFSAMYMFGFPYLLVVPPVLYFALPVSRHVKAVLVAYLLNNVVGLVCYTLFVAYGPRNWIPSRVDGVMYELYPETQAVTTAVSANTNVFPSLHTSLSVAALLFAWRTRRAYPRWFWIAAFTATSVVLSTMVLGIHWLTDVVAGVALGTWSVVAAERIVDRVERDVPLRRVDEEGGARSEVGD